MTRSQSGGGASNPFDLCETGLSHPDRRRGRLTGLGVPVLMVVAVAGCATPAEEAVPTSPSTTAATTTTTTTPPPPVKDDALPGLLPSLDELKTIMDNPALIAGPNSTGVEAPDPSQQTYEPADCASSFTAGAPPAFQDSGYRGFLGASQAQSPTPSVMLGEAVVTFDTAEAAQKALTNYVEQWRRCANKRFTWNFIAQGQQSMWTLGQPVDAGGGVTSLRNVNDNSPVTVTRAIGAKNNVLVDVQIMGSGLAEQNIEVANRILARIPG